MPAFFNGIFGHKPSPNVVPTNGHFPRGKTETFNEYLSIGPMCRYAEDLVPMLQAMAGDKLEALQLDKPVDISSLKVYVIDAEVSPVMSSSVDSELKNTQENLCTYLTERHGIKIQKVSPKLFSLLSPYLGRVCFVGRGGRFYLSNAGAQVLSCEPVD